MSCSLSLNDLLVALTNPQLFWNMTDSSDLQSVSLCFYQTPFQCLFGFKERRLIIFAKFFPLGV